MKNRHTHFPTLFLVILFSACSGGPPVANRMLTEAQAVYNEVQGNAMVVTHAPVALEQAREHLLMSEALWKDKADDTEIEHYAYLAKQRALIAQELAKINEAETLVEQAEAERQRVLLEVRTAQAEQAEREARIEREAADLARQQAEDALQRAQKLANRVNELEAKQTERGLVLTLNAVLFDVGKATLKAGAEQTVDELSDFLEAYGSRRALIEGFTDSSGPDEFNRDLSFRRASSVRTALISRGIAPDRVQVRGYGEQYPVASNGTSAGRQRNRRVEIIISDDNGIIPERRD